MSTEQHQNTTTEDSTESIEYYPESILATKKILIVGAGGLGCELLKLLVMNNFKKISIIDMDTVEKSNLNRQFLFDHSSIGKYKSETAVEKINYYRQDNSLEIKSYIGNIKDEKKFNEKFYSNFDLILNALDNNDARYFINNICIKSNIPLINSGSEGFIGMINWHIRGVTPCFACQKLIKEENIPICSIRLKPEKLEHCVAWAKMLFEQIFIENFNGDKLFENMPKKSEKFNEIIFYMSNIFYKDILTIKDTNANSNEEENKKFSEKIKPLNIFEILNIEKNNDINNINITKNDIDKYSDIYSKFIANIENINKIPDNNSNNISELLIIFLMSYYNLSKRENLFEFNKEDDDIINFIYSASNLRNINFNINLDSKFHIKEIAGKILAAIAYVNNIISSLEVIEAKKYFLIKKNPEKYLKAIWLSHGYSLTNTPAYKLAKNKFCPVCSEEALKEIEDMKIYESEINLNNKKLGELINSIKEGILNKNGDKNVNISLEVNNNLIYTEGIGLEEDEIEEFGENKTKNICEFTKNNNDLKFMVSTLNDKFEEASKKMYCLKIVNDEENKEKINFKEIMLGEKRKREDEVNNLKE